MTQFGEYPAPRFVMAHISDTHFLADDRPLYGVIRTHSNLVRALTQLENSGVRPDAIVFTGDLADLAEPDAYRRLRASVEPAAQRMGAKVIWGMGNHDERHRYALELFDEEDDGPVDHSTDSSNSTNSSNSSNSTNSTGSTDGTDGTDGTEASAHGHHYRRPQDRVYDVGGLRIIALDSTVPGYHHGELTESQLDWLAAELSSPALYGTVLALHHPPIPTPIELMALLELQGQRRFADVIRGTDVRGILAGHLHYATHSVFAGVPVSVAAATCYTMDLSASIHSLSGINGGQAFNLVQVYDEQVVHSVVPIGDFAEVSGFSALFLERMGTLTPAQRTDVFSRKDSTLSVSDIEAGHVPPG